MFNVLRLEFIVRLLLGIVTIVPLPTVSVPVPLMEMFVLAVQIDPLSLGATVPLPLTPILV